MNSLTEQNVLFTFTIERDLLQELKEEHIDFLDKTLFIEIKDVRKFIVFLITFWYEKFLQIGDLTPHTPEGIKLITRKGKRISTEKKTIARLNFYILQKVKKQWHDLVYSLMIKDNFEHKSSYSYGFFISELLKMYKVHKKEIIYQYKKDKTTKISLKLGEEITIKYRNKNIKEFKGIISKIEKNNEENILLIDIQ